MLNLYENVHAFIWVYWKLSPLKPPSLRKLDTMGTKYNFLTFKNLYEFWGNKIASAIDAEVGNNYLFNLASEEYYASVKKHLKTSKAIDFKFATIKDGKEKVIGIIAKKARGAMVRFLIKNRIEDLEPIKDFSELGFAYKGFTNNEFVFIQK